MLQFHLYIQGFLAKVDVSLIHFAFSRALKWINHPVNEMTVYFVQLSSYINWCLNAIYIKLVHLIFYSKRFLAASVKHYEGDSFHMRFLALNLERNHTHAENLTRANCCTINITDVGTISLDCLWCFIIIDCWIISPFLYPEAMETSWVFTSTYLAGSLNWAIASSMWLR